MQTNRRKATRKVLAIRLVLSVGGLLVMAQAATAADVEVSYSSLETMIVKHIMTEGGRYYLQGEPSDTCLYALIQEPRVDAIEGRLRITVLFAGRAGKQVAGRCVGPGDQFDLVISGRPTFADGEFFLDELKIEAPDTVYFRIVAPLVRSHLERRLRYRVEDGLARGAHWVGSKAGIGSLEVGAFDVGSIVVGTSALHMKVDFRLSIGKEGPPKRAGPAERGHLRPGVVRPKSRICRLRPRAAVKRQSNCTEGFHLICKGGSAVGC